MAGIKYLSDIYKKQGKEFLENLFKGEVTISEKLNGSTFSFEKSLQNDEFYFYKRDQDNPISKIDRTLMTYYEEPIHYIKALSNESKNEIPAGWRFGCEFFINNSPVAIAYDHKPKNGLVLTHIIVKNEFGDPKRTVIEKKELDHWADVLGIEKSPIIFQGKLDDESKLKIYEFLSSPFDELKIRFGTDSLAKFVISVANPALKKSALNDDLDKPIEGVVFRFGSLDGESESVSAKAIDPVFQEIAKERESQKSSFFPNDIYGISIVEVMNFILDQGIRSFEYTGETQEEKYISFICNVFEKFIEKYGDNYRGLDFNEPYYLKGQGFETNLNNIHSETTKVLIEQEESYESLFKLILSAFRKLKKKPGGFFTPGLIDQFNILVREISDYLLNDNLVMSESNIPTFGEFRKESKNFLLEEEEPEEAEETAIALDGDLDQPEISTEIVDPNVEELEASQNDDKDFMDKMRDVLNKKAGEEYTDPKEKEKVSLVIGKFQPFNNGHLKVIQRTHQETGNPIVIGVVKPKDSSNHFMDTGTLMKIVSSVMSEFSHLVRDVFVCDDDLLSTAIEECSEKYVPLSLTVGDKRKNNYLLQKKTLVKKGMIGNDFKVFDTPEWIKNAEVREAIAKKDFITFKRNVPKSVSLLWEEICRTHDSSQGEGEKYPLLGDI
jgi:nicotinamide mononucleotide adenylyltransferase